MGARARGVIGTVVLVLVLVAVATALVRRAELRDEQARLETAAVGVQATLEQEFARLFDLGNATQASLDQLDDLDPDGFAEIMEDLGVPDGYPTLISASILEVVERDDLDERLAARRAQGAFELREDAGEATLRLFTYAHPPDVAQAVLGFDLTSRRDSFLAHDGALRSGVPRLSSVTQIIQLAEGQPGASVHLPVRLPDSDRPATLGIVLAGQRFLDELSPLAGDVNVRVLDRDSISFPVFVQLGEWSDADAPQVTRELDVAGRRWEIEVAGAPGFAVSWTQRGSTYLGSAGVVVAGLLGLLAWTTASRERYARDLAARRTRELIRANEDLAAASRHKDEFLASVSHELRTPLTVISGFADTMERVPPSARSLDLVLPIQRNVRRLARLVEDLLTLASLDSGGLETHPEAVDLGPLLATAAAELAGIDPDDVRVDVAPGAVVWMDRRHLERAVTNLLTNAAQHGAPPIELTARPLEGGDVEVVVRDHGAGVSEGARTELFARFARGRDEVRSSGTGLGLAIVRELVEVGGGQLTYEPADPGARFRLRIPSPDGGGSPGGAVDEDHPEGSDRRRVGITSDRG